MSKISTHVLDAVLGKPAAGIEIGLDAAKAINGPALLLE